MRARKVDANQPEIVAALRGVGAEVTDLSRVGGGVPDLLVSYRKQWFLIECKDGKKPPSARSLTADQRAWMYRQNATTHVVNGIDDALKAIGAVGMIFREALGEDYRG